ncbi:MAG: GNAT family N-acetyltransferase [Anaerolineae bacterium]|nr:GNAT family N-acetyltransferase [Anaerolineae bacterium]
MNIVYANKMSYIKTAQEAAQAFTHDPLFITLLTNLPPAVRTQRTVNFFIPYYRLCCRLGLPLQVMERDHIVGGTCLWPSETIPLPPRLMGGVILDCFLRNHCRFTGLFRFLKWSNFIEAKHPATPHYYLDCLGIAPAWQQKGLGSAILNFVTHKADVEQVGCYLESTNPRNLAFYQRFGFQILSQEDVVVPTWFLWRDPT